MMTDLLVSALPLAAVDDPGLMTTFLAQVFLWTKVAIGIGLVIFVHELGHFAAAKLFGVKCEKFYVGFDVPIKIGPIKLPRTLGKFRYGETEYGIGILPLGGYVKMLGQDDDPRKAESEAERIRVGEGNEEETPQFDPRSFPAKPVWQRMVIISAGVVMNVVTGILFAAIAYGIGVPYTPAVVGGTTAGGPAWRSGIEPGGQVIAVGSLTEDPRLHFEEMRIAIMTEGMDTPEEPVNVSIRYADETRQYRLKTQPHPAEPDMRMIGIGSASSAVLAGNRFAGDRVAIPGSAATEAFSDEDAGATVIAVDGEPVDVDSRIPMASFKHRMHTRTDQPIRLTLRRTDGSEHEVTLPPQKARSLGIDFEIGPITGLVAGGPAESAGVRVGDRIVAIDGDEAVDAYTLALRPLEPDQPVRLTLLRGEGDSAERIDAELTPADTTVTSPPASDIADDIASTPLGLAYRPMAVVRRGISSGGENASLLQPGDVLKEVSVRWPGGKVPQVLQDALSERSLASLGEGWEFGTERPLTIFMEALQVLPVGTEVHVLAHRPAEDRIVEATLTVGESDRFWYERGVLLLPREEIDRAASVGEAMALGWREGQRRLGDVFRFLGMIVQGKVKPKHVGGPVRIVQLAGSRAEQGVSKQLLFLTLLSMNLAILNFLPIPALDGGHMVFLTYELVRGKRVDEQLEMKLTMAGILALLALMIFVFANDFLQILA